MNEYVHEVMTLPVITVGPGTSLEKIAGLMAANRIGAVPVIDRDGLLVGIVTEADLLRETTGPHGATADAVMSMPVITVDLGASIEQARAAMLRHRVGHLPVLYGSGGLAGIVSRRDLPAPRAEAGKEIRRHVIDRVLDAGGEVTDIAVHDGTVRLRARVSTPGQDPVVEHLLRIVPGLVRPDTAFDHGIATMRDPARHPFRTVPDGGLRRRTPRHAESERWPGRSARTNTSRQLAR